VVGLNDLIALLDRWQTWRETREAAARVPDLEARIADLEAKLNGEWPPDVCRACGKRALRFYQSRLAETGGVAEQWYCQECDAVEWRHRG